MLRVVYARVDEHVNSLGLDVHSGATEMQLMLDLMEVIVYLQVYARHYDEIVCATEASVMGWGGVPCPVRQPGQRGRPLFSIPLEQLEALLDLGFSMNNIAILLGVSERTVRCRREMYGLPIGRDRYTALSDTALDQVVSHILQVWMCMHYNEKDCLIN